MKTVDEFLFELTKQDIKVWVDDGRLRLNAPKGAITPDIQAELQERKPEILQFLYGNELASGDTEPILPAPRQADLPLSFSQQRLWFLDQLEGGGPAYNIPIALKLTGMLQVETLDNCLTEVVQRHEILRTTFPTAGGVPAQKIAGTRNAPLQVTDLRPLPAEVRVAKVQAIADEEATRPFDLANGPLWRVTLLKLAEEEHVLLLTMHHIISDGWSMGIFVREITALYKAHQQQTTAVLPPLPIQYADFAYWHRQWLTGDVLSTQINYWKQKLAGAPPVLELPTDKPRPPVQTFAGDICHFELGPALTQAAKALGQETQTTLLMFMLAAYAILLSRYSNQTDIVIGTPIANRSRRETHSLIGFFLNTLALRFNLSGNPSVKELLQRVRQTFYEAQTYQDLPFERLVQELQPERTASYMPLFQVMFVWQNATTQELTLPGINISFMETVNSATKFDQIFVVNESDENITGLMRYKTELFQPETIERMLQHITMLVEGMVRYPEQGILDLPLLTAVERQQALVNWNDTQGEFPEDVCLHHLFEVQAQQTPTAKAVAFGAVHLTYQELDARANQLAHYLRMRGVRPGDYVGICLERSLGMVVAVLGVQKAGAAYVPLDPAYPEARLWGIIEDLGPAAIITQEALADRFAPLTLPFICLDTEAAALAQASQASPGINVRTVDLAYVIYTSGSTGKPKGVMVTHRAAVNTIVDINERFQVGPADRVLALSELGFDLSVYDIFGTLAAGGTIILLPPAARREPALWASLMETEGVTIWNSVPALMNLFMSFIETNPVANRHSLRVVMLSGDWVPVQLPDRIRAQYPATAVYSLGGATEGAIWSIIYPIGAVDPAWKSIPYGRPLKNQRFYILNSQLQPCPIGAPGELHIGGVGVAHGYLNRPELTSQKFIPDPFSSEPEARLYKTGDLGRYLPDGNIEFMGRLDFQVKIRGFRIELGEIEAILEQNPAVSRCVALAREDTSGEKRLIAYVVLAAADATTINELRQYMAARLPEYMIPAHIVCLDAMPLTDNGKIDRHALPAPAETRLAQTKGYQGPNDELESRLVEMWQSVLGLEMVGIQDNFFELGGDSLQAAMMANQLQVWLDEIVYVVALFEHPTVAELAVMLRKQYPTAVSRALDTGTHILVESKAAVRMGPAQIDQLRRLLIAPSPNGRVPTTKNPPAIFILSPPRSGSTLLRVMLGGHPHLFAPPSLELLPYDTLHERRQHFSGGNSFWREGLIRAIMQIQQCPAEAATQLVESWENERLTTPATYARLQTWLGSKTLVDKTPSYAFDTNILARAETYFAAPIYLHLTRHPYGMISSFEQAHTDQVYQVFFQEAPAFSRRDLAELLWTISHQNILAFLAQIPTERHYHIRFEDLVQEPNKTMEALCHHLGIPFHPHMLQPYRDVKEQMTDGIHDLTSMVGDVKFHDHSHIEAGVADRWQEQITTDFLGEATWELARSLGYKPINPSLVEEVSPQQNGANSLKSISEERKRHQEATSLLANVNNLSEEEINALLAELLVEGTSSS